MLLKPIHNYYNCFCYYVSAIQRLRSSQTLVDKLKNKTELDKLTPLDKNMLWLLINYDKVELDKAQNEFINIIKYKFNQKIKSGGCPYKILTKLFAPIIFKFYRDDFEKILNELNLQHKHFSNVVSEKDFDFTTNENYNKRLYQDYCQMLEVPFQVTLSRFKVGVLCIYFSDVYARNYKNKEEPSFNSGHAVTITLSTDDKFYVLDDSHMLVLFDTYLEFIFDTLYEIELKDINDESIKLLINQINDNQNLKDKFIFDNRIYRFVIKKKSNNVLLGGELEEVEQTQLEQTSTQQIETQNLSETQNSTENQNLSEQQAQTKDVETLFDTQAKRIYNLESKKKKGIYIALVLFVIIIILIVYIIVLVKKSKTSKAQVERQQVETQNLSEQTDTKNQQEESDDETEFFKLRND